MTNRTPTHRQLCRALISSLRPSHQCRHYVAATSTAATVAPTVPAPTPSQMTTENVPIQRYPPTQPPSYKPAHLRKTQLHRQYTSLLRSTPLMLVFQHNNLLASEWASVRRELYNALQRLSSTDPTTPDLSDAIRLQVIQTSIFSAALRVVEFYNPSIPTLSPTTSNATHASAQAAAVTAHDLSRAAHAATRDPSRGPHAKHNTTLHPLLRGPVAILTLPEVSPRHLAAALRILAPTPGARSAFPAPRRRDVPSWHEPGVQNGLAKLVLLGARVESRTMDGEGVRWVGAIQGGLDGLRAEVVACLQKARGAAVVGALEGVGRGVWVTMEGRRRDLEEKESGGGGGEGQ